MEQVELAEPRRALKRAGAHVQVISPEPGRVQAFNHLDKGDTFSVHRAVGEASASDYDGLVLPGGVANPDALRMDPNAVRFVREFFADGKPVGAICHGAWMLVEADVVRHRTVTSWPSLRTDICNAGAYWVDEEVHVDRGLVTSRKPADLPAFCAKLIEEFAEGPHTTVPRETPVADSHAITPGDEDAAVDVAGADSFPASDPPSSLKIT